MKRLVIIGAGAHSKVILDTLLLCDEYEIVGLTDNSKVGQVLGYPILGSDECLPELHDCGVECAFVALGNNALRKKMFSRAQGLGFDMINAISPYAHISRFAVLGCGVAMMPGAAVNACAKIGNGVIVNTNAAVDHDCIIGEFTHIAPGCAISGSTTIGSGCFLGTGSHVIDRLTIGNNVMLGAGGVVVKDLECDCEAVGVPARIIKKL